MKTRDKILAAALDLFNAEGVGGQSALDIATSMGISAGHLYYHFKGKPEILVGLMTRHGEEIDLIATALRDAAHSVDLDLQTLWTHVHILVEEVWDARFFWRETALAGTLPDLADQARHILKTIRSAVRETLGALADQGSLCASPEILDGFADQITTGIAFQTSVLTLESAPGSPRERIARAAAQIMLPVAGLTQQPPT
ncbi:MAG: TetR/AcrR family transcriptional regulator [Alphaproteobacteria bacterium]|jgi:AcrR family transcriptional regulator